MASITRLEQMRRLIAVDAALASDDGLSVAVIAEQYGVRDTAIRRDMRLLADLGLRPEYNSTQFVWRYATPGKLFTDSAPQRRGPKPALTGAQAQLLVSRYGTAERAGRETGIVPETIRNTLRRHRKWRPD